MGDAQHRQVECNIIAHRPFCVLSCRFDTSEPVRGLVGKIHWTGQSTRHERVLRHLHQRPGRVYGSTGPSSIDPDNPSKGPYGTKFPILSVFDMVRAQFVLLDHLGIEKLYASVGSSMGGMQSLAAGWLHPERVGKIVSISGTARSSPAAIAMRFAQRSGAYTSLFIAVTDICLQS
jgi:pimeloyl-ACP methyl ester carboxylesterase